MTTLITAATATTEYPVSKLNGRKQKSEEDDDDDESAHKTATDLEEKARKQSFCLASAHSTLLFQRLRVAHVQYMVWPRILISHDEKLCLKQSENKMVLK